jgi:uncharacterized protein (TIGR02117 family)
MFAVLLHGCVRDVVRDAPPAACTSAHRLHVVGHGWHAGVVVKRVDLVARIPSLAADFPESEYLEIGWGDEAFYRAERGTVALAVRALFNSVSSALQVVAFSGSPRAHFPQSEHVELCANDRSYGAVVDYVANTFTRDADGRVLRLARSQYGDGWFYRAEGQFSLRKTCNTWVAQAFAHAGYPVSTLAVRSGELLAELRALP